MFPPFPRHQQVLTIGCKIKHLLEAWWRGGRPHLVRGTISNTVGVGCGRLVCVNSFASLLRSPTSPVSYTRQLHPSVTTVNVLSCLLPPLPFFLLFFFVSSYTPFFSFFRFILFYITHLCFPPLLSPLFLSYYDSTSFFPSLFILPLLYHPSKFSLDSFCHNYWSLLLLLLRLPFICYHYFIHSHYFSPSHCSLSYL